MDIDIDSANRGNILKLIDYTSAGIVRQGELIKHNTGVYVCPVPRDPVTKICTIDHKQAESMGYIKLDLLNVNVYERVQNRKHLQQLSNTEPQWHLLKDPDFVSQLIHIGNHYSSLQKMPEPVSSVDHMAMFLALIRPAKRHLIGLPWNQVEQSVWQKPDDDSYYFKKAHAYSYAYLVIVNMNLNIEA